MHVSAVIGDVPDRAMAAGSGQEAAARCCVDASGLQVEDIRAGGTAGIGFVVERNPHLLFRR